MRSDNRTRLHKLLREAAPLTERLRAAGVPGDPTLFAAILIRPHALRNLDYLRRLGSEIPELVYQLARMQGNANGGQQALSGVESEPRKRLGAVQ